MGHAKQNRQPYSVDASRLKVMNPHTHTGCHQFYSVWFGLIMKSWALGNGNVLRQVYLFLDVAIKENVPDVSSSDNPCTTFLMSLQLEVTKNPPDEMEVDSSAADSTPTSSAPVVAPSGDKPTNSAARYRPPRPVDPHQHHHQFSGTSGTGGSVGVREGAATDQEESGCQRERGRPNSASLAPKPSKAEDGGLSSLRFGVAVGGGEVSFGSGTGEQASTGGALVPVLEGAERRSRQDSSRSPLPHQNASGGEDDASVLDTPLQEKVGGVAVPSRLLGGGT